MYSISITNKLLIKIYITCITVLLPLISIRGLGALSLFKQLWALDRGDPGQWPECHRAHTETDI